MINVNRQASAIVRRWQSTEAPSKSVPQTSSERAESPEYPEILDLNRDAVRVRKRLAWHEEVKEVKTIEEKLIKVNMPKYYGFQMMVMKEELLPYNCLPYIQHWTRTQYQNEIPKSWNKLSDEEVDKLVDLIKDRIEESLHFQYAECR